ncbi:MAG: RNA 2',3'-cyclic phosphodiesterase, partial [Elusimicrobia bacterium]|nr:RNA 2',3'-cyclic phosphodiesterase [Elusimicrobiota bacterium]
MRLFLAVRLTEEVQSQVRVVIQQLARVGADVKWVELQNLHLTLRFLGEVTDDQRAMLEQALEARPRSQPPFTVMFAGVGGFPTLDHPRVLWVGVIHGEESLKILAQGVEETCQTAGFPPADRPLSGHLTMG